jgi:hypothetical protein
MLTRVVASGVAITLRPASTERDRLKRVGRTRHMTGSPRKGQTALGAVSNDYFLQVSGMKFTYDATKPLFQRVTAMALVPPSGAGHIIDPTNTAQCYKVVATYFVANLLGVVSSPTGGALSVNAKESDCTTPVTDFATHIVDAAPATTGLQELKQWQAVTSYFSKLPDADADGTPDVPAFYSAVQGRIGTQ